MGESYLVVDGRDPFDRAPLDLRFHNLGCQVGQVQWEKARQSDRRVHAITIGKESKAKGDNCDGGAPRTPLIPGGVRPLLKPCIPENRVLTDLQEGFRKSSS